MQSANNFIVLNIREYLASEDKRLGEDKLVQLLSEFSCPLNPDVERFLKKQAIDFAKKHQAVTYLVLSLEDAELLGYFSITIKPLVVKAEPFSNTAKRKLARFSEIREYSFIDDILSWAEKLPEICRSQAKATNI